MRVEGQFAMQKLDNNLKKHQLQHMRTICLVMLFTREVLSRNLANPLSTLANISNVKLLRPVSFVHLQKQFKVHNLLDNMLYPSPTGMCISCPRWGSGALLIAFAISYEFDYSTQYLIWPNRLYQCIW